MAGPKKWTEELIDARVKAGRGQGSGQTYSPWLNVQEFSSRGTQTRVPSHKLNRTIHTFSYLERALFLVTEFQTNFVDFNEQRPLDRGVTLGAAAKLGIRHPRYPRTNVPVVMTMDALVTTTDADGVLTFAAWDVKPQRRLQDERVLAKLSLHKAYCAQQGIPHYLFTENSVSPYVVRNIDWIRMALPKDGEQEVVPGLFTGHLDQFQDDLFTCRTRPTISHFCGQYDAAHKVDRGTGLRIFKLLLWQHRVDMDLNVQWLERQPIPRRGEVAPTPSLRKAA
ncbi:TnsA endonuclease N-terminal domain-containing protein [Paucibacter sp. JuS9]|uniref:TnsA endonuclease N-terminal domain-containing protein n=1 Tax=Paucibacter sp. JuS9 TaxID=3228748 RepID=UPI0037573E9D